jgi:transcriptional regulator with XRE-family HTH domain
LNKPENDGVDRLISEPPTSDFFWRVIRPVAAASRAWALCRRGALDSSAVAMFFFGSRFGDNLARLLGVHRLTGSRASSLLDVSPQALSDWSHGKRQPEPDTLERVSKFFDVRPERLAHAEFADLLANELADPQRFERVEARIRRAGRR